MRVTNAIEEAVEVEQNEVVGVVVFDDGKVACDICRKRFLARKRLSTHKAIYRILKKYIYKYIIILSHMKLMQNFNKLFKFCS